MYLCIKRGFDILFSVVMIVVMLPVWIFAICAVKLSSPGPLLFSQPRGGLKCRPFISYKFRTMRSDHVHDPTEVMPLNHPHITPLGRFLRRTKIDELPQLFNVFKGDMSVIGPRPTIMDQVNAYDDFQRRRQDVRPGLTGLAQVNTNPEMDWDERIKYDVYYVDHLGPWLDLQILAKTLVVVVLGEKRFSRRFEESPFAMKLARKNANS